MSAITTNYGLIKPGLDDFYDIATANSNMDQIEEGMTELKEGKINIEVIPEGSELLAGQRKSRTFYLKVTKQPSIGR